MKNPSTRRYTRHLLQMLADGKLDAATVAADLLGDYLSERDVEDYALCELGIDLDDAEGEQ